MIKIGKEEQQPEKSTWMFRSGPLGTSVGVLIFALIIGSIVLSTMYFFLTSPERKATGRIREEKIGEKFASEEYIKKFEE